MLHGIRKSVCLLFVTAVVSLHGYAQNSRTIAPNAPRVFTIDARGLLALRERIRKDPTSYAPIIQRLRDEAAGFSEVEPWTITKKTLLPPSGNKHDYESQGPYWWPDPASSDGLPYMRRDGEKNPEIEKLIDHRYLIEMTNAVKKLSLAYFLTNDESYAARAALFLRTWFLDEETRMNPHLNYGQRIPGRTDGRDIGIIETRNLGDIVDAVGMLQRSPAWSDADQQGMEKWMSQYLEWLRTSEHGRGEARQRNNHGTWYDVQVAALALFTRQNDIAREALVRARDERLAKHIEPDGRQPHELARTRSWSYSVMNLQSFFTLATLGEKVDVDIWHHVSPDGRSLVKALDFLIQYADASNGKPWPYKQITEMDPTLILPLLYQADCKFHRGNYGELARKLEKDKTTMYELYYPCHRGAAR